MDDAVSVKSASPATTMSSGTKRKRNTEPKFYAVRFGHKPGIYHSWTECLNQVRGFKKAIFKSFFSLTEAERFLAGDDSPTESHSVSSSPSKFYAVKNGRMPGIYTDWPSAQAQITGWTKPKHRCFSTRAEAQTFLEGSDHKASERLGKGNAEGKPGELQASQDRVKGNIDEPPAKRAKNASTGRAGTKIANSPNLQYNAKDYEPGTGPLPPGAEDGFDPYIQLDPRTGELVFRTEEQRNAVKIQAAGSAPNSVIRIHTDGSSLRNGTKGALAGVGVYFGPNDGRNLSESLPGPRQTNQRAELTAILRALEIVPRDRDVTIVTDSRYAIDCVTVWFRNWRKNGWRTSEGKAVENKDIVENILAKIEERSSLRRETLFEWIKGHAQNPGNIAADRLAVNGARAAI